MSLNLTRKNNVKENDMQHSGKAREKAQTKETFFTLLIIGIICFVCGYKTWSKVLDKHVKY